MFMPPLKLLLTVVDKDLGNDSNATVVVPAALLRYLVKQAVRASAFDEQSYLAANPDVAAAIRRGEYSSGHEHYVNFGYLEGRDGGGPVFSERWYLRINPDVSEAVRLGVWTSGLHHYQTVGMLEWRSPNPDVVDEIEAWRALLSVKVAEPQPEPAEA
jgi:hypothetical protein